MAVYSYPAPRSPEYRKPTSVEECLPHARAMVNKETGSMRSVPVKPGDRILVVSLPDQDKFVAEAFAQALKEVGALQVDFIYPLELAGKNAEKTSVADGWRELDLFKEGRGSGAVSEQDLLTGLGLGDALRKYLTENPQYTGVFCDVAGRQVRRSLAEHAGKFKGFWHCNNWEELLSKVRVFPDELWKEIEKKVIEPLGEASTVRITDPEGTYLEYVLSDEEAKRWQMFAKNYSGHLAMDPMMATTSEYSSQSTRAPFILPDLNGVLAGTANHCGFFPRIEAHFEHCRLVEVKGGGKYGDGIRELMDKHRDVQWPGFPAKGLFWFCDSALGTSVKAFRRKSDMFNSYWLYPNMNDKTRAGILHSGFGSRRHGKHGEELVKYATEKNLPTGHIHVHSYHPTLEIKLRNTSYWYKVIDKGRLTVLDEPDIRAIAAKYDYPDELLGHDWIPPLPGVNCDGDYLRDFAPDPAAYLKKRMAEDKPV